MNFPIFIQIKILYQKTGEGDLIQGQCDFEKYKIAKFQ